MRYIFEKIQKQVYFCRKMRKKFKILKENEGKNSKTLVRFKIRARKSLVRMKF